MKIDNTDSNNPSSPWRLAMATEFFDSTKGAWTMLDTRGKHMFDVDQGDEDLVIAEEMPAVCAKLFSRNTLIRGSLPVFNVDQQSAFWPVHDEAEGVRFMVHCVLREQNEQGIEQGFPLDCCPELFVQYIEKSYYSQTCVGWCTLEMLRNAGYEKELRDQYRPFVKIVKSLHYLAEETRNRHIKTNDDVWIRLERSDVRFVYWLYWPLKLQHMAIGSVSTNVAAESNSDADKQEEIVTVTDEFTNEDVGADDSSMPPLIESKAFEMEPVEQAMAVQDFQNALQDFYAIKTSCSDETDDASSFDRLIDQLEAQNVAESEPENAELNNNEGKQSAEETDAKEQEQQQAYDTTYWAEQYMAMKQKTSQRHYALLDQIYFGTVESTICNDSAVEFFAEKPDHVVIDIPSSVYVYNNASTDSNGVPETDNAIVEYSRVKNMHDESSDDSLTIADEESNTSSSISSESDDESSDDESISEEESSSESSVSYKYSSSSCSDSEDSSDSESSYDIPNVDNSESSSSESSNLDETSSQGESDPLPPLIDLETCQPVLPSASTYIDFSWLTERSEPESYHCDTAQEYFSACFGISTTHIVVGTIEEHRAQFYDWFTNNDMDNQIGSVSSDSKSLIDCMEMAFKAGNAAQNCQSNDYYNVRPALRVTDWYSSKSRLTSYFRSHSHGTVATLIDMAGDLSTQAHLIGAPLTFIVLTPSAAHSDMCAAIEIMSARYNLSNEKQKQLLLDWHAEHGQMLQAMTSRDVIVVPVASSTFMAPVPVIVRNVFPETDALVECEKKYL